MLHSARLRAGRCTRVQSPPFGGSVLWARLPRARARGNRQVPPFGGWRRPIGRRRAVRVAFSRPPFGSLGTARGGGARPRRQTGQTSYQQRRYDPIGEREERRGG